LWLPQNSSVLNESTSGNRCTSCNGIAYSVYYEMGVVLSRFWTFIVVNFPYEQLAPKRATLSKSRQNGSPVREIASPLLMMRWNHLQ
jgi:hypothetical protein